MGRRVTCGTRLLIAQLLHKVHVVSWRKRQPISVSTLPSHSYLRFADSFLCVAVLYTPPLTFIYFLWQHCLSDGPSSSACQTAASQVWPTLKVNWVYWSAVHIATFSLIPLSYRVAFVSVKNFLWGGYLSYAAAQRDGEATSSSSEAMAAPQRFLRRQGSHM